jgi:ABC-type branched-subunit amino acid transport system ATPase component
MRFEVENLTRAFGGLVAVNGVSVKFPPNKVHGIIGPNGAGKTTFINVLSGALKPTARKRAPGERGDRRSAAA